MSMIATSIAAMIVAAAVVVHAASSRYEMHAQKEDSLITVVRFDRLTGDTKICTSSLPSLRAGSCIDHYFDHPTNFPTTS